NCPSVYFWTDAEFRGGTGGDMRSANGTPVFCPSSPWQTTQYCEKFFCPAWMFPSVAGKGFTSFLPPTLIVRLNPCATAVSTRPGWWTWQPANVTAQAPSRHATRIFLTVEFIPPPQSSSSCCRDLRRKSDRRSLCTCLSLQA